MFSRSTDSSRATSNRSRLPLHLFLFCLVTYLALSGARVASSDGNTMLRVAESMLGGGLAIEEGWNGTHGRDGRFYAKADPGQAVLALPWVVVGRLTAPLIPETSPLRHLWPRIVASTFNSVISAGCVVAFLFVVRALGYSTQTALVMALALGFTTPLLAYSKSFMREPALMLATLATFLEIYRGRPGRAGVWLAIGAVVKSSLFLVLAFFVVYVIARRRACGEAGWPAVRRLITAPIIASLVLALHNWLRFESITRSGYDPTVDTFTTPVLVGLYGQLVSSGKSIFLYAPLAFVALWGYRRLIRHHTAEGWLAIAIVAANVILHAKFASWAGEGSWGPRYLVPFLPWMILPAAELVQSGRAWARRAAWLAVALGLVVQIGGSAIYFGSYMRDLGEYPYTRNFSDPLFMVRSHFVPNHTPVVGHWRLLVRNARLLVSDARPDLRPEPTDGRLPLADEDRDALKYVVDFWFCYALYVGVRAVVVVPAVLAALALSVAAWVALMREARRTEDIAPEPCPW